MILKLILMTISYKIKQIFRKEIKISSSEDALQKSFDLADKQFPDIEDAIEEVLE